MATTTNKISNIYILKIVIVQEQKHKNYQAHKTSAPNHSSTSIIKRTA